MRLLLTALLLVPAIAAADTKAPPAPSPSRTADAQQMKTDDCARARKQNKTCVIDMGKGEDIEGTTGKGEGIGVAVIQTGKQPSLIRIRRDFIAEIIKSAEDL